MDALKKFVDRLVGIGWSEDKNEKLLRSRAIVAEINRFLFTTHDDLGVVDTLGDSRRLFSDYHLFWHANHKDILGLEISDEKCRLVASKLHDVYLKTQGRVFLELPDTCGLSKEQYCRVRMLTANQDFRGSRVLSDLAKTYKKSPEIFDARRIADNPADFINAIRVENLSQNDKRIRFAKRFAEFVLEHGRDPVSLINSFDGDIYSLRMAMIGCEGAGYGNKKTDMVLRDMVVQGVWPDVRGFNRIDVASDINTIGVALRTGILRSAIPLVSSFLDIFCYQYTHVDEMSAKAWRRVWELWHAQYPGETIDSPCLMDYFIYNVIGKQFCQKKLLVFQCERGHEFRWHTGRNKYCKVCEREGVKKVTANVVRKMLPCEDEEGCIYINNTEYVKSGSAPMGMHQCPFKEICDAVGRKMFEPPKSISILGQTGWSTAYAQSGAGGGGLMA